MTPIWKIIVPWRSGVRERDRAWDWALPWWRRFGAEIIVSEQAGPGPFNRAACLNAGATRAWPWDVALFIDADVVEDQDEQVTEAIRLAWETGRLTVGHTGAKDLNAAGTAKLFTGARFDWNRFVYQRRSICNSRVNAVRADLFEIVGGFDARMQGWGHEDGAFMRACVAARGELARVPGDCWHLWHEPAIRAAKRTLEYARNRELAGRYIEAFNGEISCITALPGPPETRGWPAVKAILDERTPTERWDRP